MKYALSGLACCVTLAGCQTIPWQETGPLMKMVNISTGPEECMALADLNGKLLVTKDRILALNSHGCNNINDKDGIKVLKADSIVIEDAGARSASIKFSWGGWSVVRNTPSSWKFIWVPPKKTNQ